MTILPSLVLRTAYLSILLCLSSLVSAGSEPAFWRVTQGKATVYLMGSMHFGAEDFYPLPKEIEQAYQQAQVLAVEVDMSRITPETAGAAIHRYGRLPLGQTLSQRLSSGVYAELTARSEQANLPMAALEQFQPWFVAVQLVEAEIRKTPLRQGLGIDMYFINKGSKPIHELETLEQQLALFGNLTMQEQEAFLAQTLADMDNSRVYLKAMATDWQEGDVEQLEKTLIDPFQENPQTKKLFRHIFIDRNDRMTEAVVRFLAEGQTVFFTVGAGHMLGEHGIVAQLKRKGFDVTRVQYAPQ